MILKDRVAIITGAATGIGYGTAKVFLEEGAVVNICDIRPDAIEKATKELADFGRVCGYVVDIAKKEQVDEFVEKVMKEFGRIDILINNAGITKDAQFYKMVDDQFEAVINVNLKGTYNVCKSVVPHMIEQKYGKIVNLSSVSAYNGNFGQANYAASKAAIMGMTRVMGKELGKYGINVNAIAPGSILTDMYAAVPEEKRQKKLQSIPLRRYGTPEEVGKLLAFLSSNEASYITSQTITIDGGYN